MKGLQGKVALVSGGATLIGAGVAKAFAQAGVQVVIADIDADGGARVAAEAGDRVRFIRTDITSDAEIGSCVARTVDELGGMDFLVNLACTYLDDGFASERADWLTSINVNTVSAVMLARAVHPHLVARGGGAIVNFGSISSKVAQTGRWLYPASKAALVHVTRSMAMDFARDRIRVNSVSPGWTWSAVMDRLTSGDRNKTDRVAAPFHLLQRVGDPAEVAATVLFLCSDDASFVTGADWAVDGGYSAMGPEQAVPAIPLLAD